MAEDVKKLSEDDDKICEEFLKNQQKQINLQVLQLQFFGVPQKLIDDALNVSK